MQKRGLVCLAKNVSINFTKSLDLHLNLISPSFSLSGELYKTTFSPVEGAPMLHFVAGISNRYCGCEPFSGIFHPGEPYSAE